jgi:hypothetical protein
MRTWAAQNLDRWADKIAEVAVRYEVQVGVSQLPSFDDAGTHCRYSKAIKRNNRLDQGYHARPGKTYKLKKRW